MTCFPEINLLETERPDYQMECKSRTIIQSKDCDKNKNTGIQEQDFNHKISGSENNLLQIETCFVDCVWNSDVNTKIKQETWNTDEVSDIKCYPENPPTLDHISFLSKDTIKVGDEPYIKEEHLNQKEISTQLLKQSEIYYVECDAGDHTDTKIRIKQETWGANNVISSGIKSDQEEPSAYLESVTIKGGDEVDIKEDHMCFVGVSTNTHSEEKESNAEKNKTSKEILPQETPRSPTEATFVNTVTPSDVEEHGSSHRPVSVKNTCQRVSMNKKTPNCNPTYDSVQFEWKQLMSDKSKPVYRCEICENCYTRKSNLKIHKLLHSCTNLYKCELCEKNFTDKSSLQRHALLHSGTKPYKCDMCEKAYTHKTSLKIHTLLHTGTKPYKCDMCDKCFTRKSSLQRHTWLHTGTKPYKCDTCEKCFTDNSDLQSHILLHSGSKPYKCDQCEKSFTWKHSLQRHIFLHSESKPYKCDMCNRCFTQKIDLQSHMFLHSGTKPYKCDECEMSFTRNSQLQKHIVLHSGTKSFKCDICDSCFTWKHQLLSHILLHSGTKPYKCDLCEKCFIHKSHLTRHLLLHSSLKPHKCDICERCFTHKSDLTRHTLLHSSIKPYECDRCGKCFSRNFTLKKHLLLHSRPHT